jgi:mRNA interferase YafQ
MLLPVYTRQFSKDIKKLQRSGQPLEDLKTVMRNLIAEISLSPKYRDHRLIGNWQGRRECHIRPDLLLIYKINQEKHSLIFERLGSHADLFD